VGGQPRVVVGGVNIDGFAAINTLGNKSDLVAQNNFIIAFKAVSGASSTASNPDILAYFGKGFSGKQAAALYNATPRIPASILTKGDGTVDFVGVDGTSKTYDLKTTAGINDYQAEKKAKEDADEDARKKAALATAKTAAISAIKTLMEDTSNNQTKLTDEEVKTQLNKTEANLIDGTTIKD